MQQKMNHMDWLNPSVNKSLLHGKWDVGQVDYLLLLCLVVLNWLHSIFSSIIVFFRNTQSYRLHSRASSSQHYSTPRNMYDHAILIRPIFLQCTIVVPTMLGSVHLVCDIRILWEGSWGLRCIYWTVLSVSPCSLFAVINYMPLSYSYLPQNSVSDVKGKMYIDSYNWKMAARKLASFAIILLQLDPQ